MNSPHENKITPPVETDPFIHTTAIVDPGCQLGNGSKVWHYSHLMSGSRIGPDCIIGQNVFIGAGVTVGRGCKIQNNVSLYTGVVCEDEVFLGPSCVFTNVLTPRAFVERKTEYQETYIKRGASIGANATILCGHTIGKYALIGAGAVVTTDIPDHALYIGCPARHAGWVSRYGCVLKFDTEGLAQCPESGERYVLNEEKVSLISSES